MRSLTPLLLLAAAGCSGTWKSPELGVEMEVPKGYSAPTVSGNAADFGGGLFLVRVDEKLPQLGTIPHDEQAKAALTKLPREAPLTTITSRREGDVAGTKLLRFDLRDGPSKGLLYIIPRGPKYFVLYADASGSDADAKLNRVERAFGTLKFRD